MLLLLLSTVSSSMYAQDDVYSFSTKDSKKEGSAYKATRTQGNASETRVYHSGSNRDVDEYNRRNRNARSGYNMQNGDTLAFDGFSFETGDGVYGDTTYTQAKRMPRNYDWTEYDDEDDVDFVYSRRISRFYDPWYFGYFPYDSWYYGPYGYYGWRHGWYHTYYSWYDPWYDPWYYPYYGYGWRYRYYYDYYYPYRYYGYYYPARYRANSWTDNRFDRSSQNYTFRDGGSRTMRNEAGSYRRFGSANNSTRGSSTANSSSTRGVRVFNSGSFGGSRATNSGTYRNSGSSSTYTPSRSSSSNSSFGGSFGGSRSSGGGSFGGSRSSGGGGGGARFGGRR